jgi:cysteine desulfurase/selenocysteine lyase
MEKTPQTVLDSAQIRAEFPILDRETRPGVTLKYLDNAATSQKPLQVISAMSEYYESRNANIHRGIHRLAEEATMQYEAARVKIAEFIGAGSGKEIIFTRNTTESINLVAYSWGRSNLKAGDRIVLTEMEHHSNLVPWQILAGEMGIVLDFVKVTEDGKLDPSDYSKKLEQGPRLVGFTHMSNVLGTINPAKELIDQAHAIGAVVLVDGAQSVPHLPVNLEGLDADFYAFSAHKMCGPTGIGVLYGRAELLEAMPPFMGGGDMIKRVELTGFSANDLPYKFEAGTPAIAEAIGLGAAVDFLSEIGMEAVLHHERELTRYALERLDEVPGIHVLGPSAEEKGGVVSFEFDGVHPHDVAQILDDDGIAVRAGHHCAMPLHERFQVPASTRASFYIYNTRSEIDALIEGLYKVKEMFA